MEAVTAGRAVKADMGTGSKTIADLLPLAVRKYAELAAQRHKEGDRWVDASYAGARPDGARSGARTRRPRHPAGRQGLDPRPPGPSGPRLLRHPHRRRHARHDPRRTRPRSASTCLALDSRAVFVEDAEQLDKIRKVRASCPDLRHIVVMEPGADYDPMTP